MLSVVFCSLLQISTSFLKLAFLLFDTVYAANTGRIFFESSGSIYRRQLFTELIGNFVFNSWINSVSEPSPQPQNSQKNIALRRSAQTSVKLQS